MKSYFLCGLLILAPTVSQAGSDTFETKDNGHGFVYGYGIKTQGDETFRHNGAGIEAGFQFTPNFALYGGYQNHTTNQDSVGKDDGVHGAVFGATYNIRPSMDVFSHLSWHSDTHADFAAGVDLYYPLSDDWQVRGRIGAQGDSGAFFALGLRYDFAHEMTATMPRKAPPPLPTPSKKVLRQQFVLDVKFAHDKADITSDYIPQTDRLAAILTQDKDLTLTIEGHTSLVGSDAYNLDLSKRRANAVRDLLINRYNIAPDRITAIGYGEKHPIAYGETPEAQKANRRVVALVYYWPKK